MQLSQFIVNSDFFGVTPMWRTSKIAIDYILEGQVLDHSIHFSMSMTMTTSHDS